MPKKITQSIMIDEREYNILKYFSEKYHVSLSDVGRQAILCLNRHKIEFKLKIKKNKFN